MFLRVLKTHTWQERLGRKYFNNLSSISCGVASSSKLDPAAGLALHLQLDQAEVVTWGKIGYLPCVIKQFMSRCNAVNPHQPTWLCLPKKFFTNLFRRHHGPVCQCRNRTGVPWLWNVKFQSNSGGEFTNFASKAIAQSYSSWGSMVIIRRKYCACKV